MAVAQSKPFPAGIIRFFSTSVSKPENDPSWNNVNLDGVRLRPIWSDLGVYVRAGRSLPATLDVFLQLLAEEIAAGEQVENAGYA